MNASVTRAAAGLPGEIAGMTGAFGGHTLVRRFLAEGEPGLTPRSRRPAVASTGVKNPDYSDAMYITELVVADTVNGLE